MVSYLILELHTYYYIATFYLTIALSLAFLVASMFRFTSNYFYYLALSYSIFMSIVFYFRIRSAYNANLTLPSDNGHIFIGGKITTLGVYHTFSSTFFYFFGFSIIMILSIFLKKKFFEQNP